LLNYENGFIPAGYHGRRMSVKGWCFLPKSPLQTRYAMPVALTIAGAAKYAVSDLECVCVLESLIEGG
jgi:hypothetical protein